MRFAQISGGAVFLHRTELGKWSYVSFEDSGLSELVAQLVEQRPFKAWVVRSNRTELTTHRPCLPYPKFLPPFWWRLRPAATKLCIGNSYPAGHYSIPCPRRSEPA